MPRLVRVVHAVGPLGFFILPIHLPIHAAQYAGGDLHQATKAQPNNRFNPRRPSRAATDLIPAFRNSLAFQPTPPSRVATFMGGPERRQERRIP
jgi:hypothetical protein